MKVQLFKLSLSQDALTRLAGQTMPARLSYQIGMLMRNAAPMLAQFEETRLELCRKYGRYNVNANIYEFDNGQREQFEAEFNELAGAEVELPGAETIAVDERFERVQLSPNDMLTLDWLLK